MTSQASTGNGKAWTGRKPKRRWVGKKTGKNPTDRGKLGVKRSVLTDAAGVPIGVAVAGANVHDQRLVEATLKSIPVRRPQPTPRRKQHLCGDKGYDSHAVRQAGRRRRYVVHIPRKGEDATTPKRKHGKARRWVVERTHSWINRARRLLIRWEKKAVNYVGFLHLQFAITALRTAGVLG
jgi:transposase